MGLWRVTLYRWPAKQTIPLSVLARNKTKGFWTWNLGVAGRGNGTREESWLEKGADRVGVEPRTGAVDTRHRSGETVAENIGSSEEDRVKRCRHSSCFVEFSLVIHASVSPYMLSEMECCIVSFCSELTPSIVRVCSFVLFSPVPSIVFLWWQEMCVTPLGTTSWSPTGQERKWLGDWSNVCGGEGVNVKGEPNSIYYGECSISVIEVIYYYYNK